MPATVAAPPATAPAYTKYKWYFPQTGRTYGGVTHCTA